MLGRHALAATGSATDGYAREHRVHERAFANARARRCAIARSRIAGGRALARPTWMPAILCEGAFVIVPDQEAALRTTEFQSRYAIGILEGLEAYFRDLGQSR